MRRRLALALAVSALVGLPAGASAATPSPAVLPAKTCPAGFVHARLSWGEKRLHAGEFCKVGNREYLRYGVVRSPSRHLRRR